MAKYDQYYTLKKSQRTKKISEVLVVLLIFASAFLWLFL